MNNFISYIAFFQLEKCIFKQKRKRNKTFLDMKIRFQMFINKKNTVRSFIFMQFYIQIFNVNNSVLFQHIFFLFVIVCLFLFSVSLVHEDYETSYLL